LPVLTLLLAFYAAIAIPSYVRVIAFADALLRLGDVPRGKALLLRSLQIKIDRHGKKSPLVAAAMVHHAARVAAAASSRDKLQITIAAALDAPKAKEFLVKALAILEACYGEFMWWYVWRGVAAGLDIRVL
jgi:hypothetical protein